MSVLDLYNIQVNSLKLKGLKVVKNVYSNHEPSITHGRFEIQNIGAESESLTIYKVNCRANNHLISVPDYYLYLLPDYIEHEKKYIVQAPMAVTRYELSFSPVSAAEYSHKKIKIEVIFSVNGKMATLYCPYVFDFRTNISI